MTDEQVVDTYGPMVYRIAKNYLKTSFDADDVYSETFLRYFRKRRTFESEEHRKAWLIRVTINCAKDLFGRRSSGAELPENTADSEDETAEPAGEDLSYVREAVDSLPRDDAAIVYMFYYEDLPTERIAETLGISPEAARKRLSRAREKLKGLLN